MLQSGVKKVSAENTRCCTFFMIQIIPIKLICSFSSSSATTATNSRSRKGGEKQRPADTTPHTNERRTPILIEELIRYTISPFRPNLRFRWISYQNHAPHDMQMLDSGYLPIFHVEMTNKEQVLSQNPVSPPVLHRQNTISPAL